jgi:hypothetical protein
MRRATTQLRTGNFPLPSGRKLESSSLDGAVGVAPSSDVRLLDAGFRWDDVEVQVDLALTSS